MPEFLYVIRRLDGVRKVGRSCNPQQRLAQIVNEVPADQRDGLTVEHQAECPAARVAKAETYAQYLLREWRYQGEWFQTDAETCRNAVDAAAAIAATSDPFPKPALERLNICIAPSLRREIKTWRHRNHIDTEGEAIRQLLRFALHAAGIKT